MHAHIEPALRAWQAAWASNPSHSLERPNPFGAGPLSADCIPLLDLAYVRLFINLGRSKEAFWQRDYDAMAEELAKGSEVVQGQDVDSGTSNGDLTDSTQAGVKSESRSQTEPRGNQASRRERNLRKAAFYAADSLSMSDKLGLTYAEHTWRELPTQSAMCTFDCAQVVAEWVAAVQKRVGRYLGIIGRDEINLMEVPGILLLEDDDRLLMHKIDEILTSAEQKIETQENIDLGAVREGGHGSRILMLTAYMLERDAVWPGEFVLHVRLIQANHVTVFKLMAQSLQTQASYVKDRAVASVSGIEPFAPSQLA
jgi:hypothetical protein